MLLQWHVKDPGHSAKSAGGRLHLNKHTPLTHRSLSGLTMPLSRHSVGTYRETSLYATRQGTLGHSRLRSLTHCGLTHCGLKSEISVRELISTLKKKKKKKHRRGMNCPTFSKKSPHARKKPPPSPPSPGPLVTKWWFLMLRYLADRIPFFPHHRCFCTFIVVHIIVVFLKFHRSPHHRRFFNFVVVPHHRRHYTFIVVHIIVVSFISS